MKATKYILEINVECLSKDSFNSLISSAVEQIHGEVDSGDLHFDDGDNVSWKISANKVDF